MRIVPAMPLFLFLMFLVAAPPGEAQLPASAPPAAAVSASAPPEHSAEALYLRLRDVGLDKSRVYHIREVTLERAAHSSRAKAKCC
jgi:hypothetical protein